MIKYRIQTEVDGAKKWYFAESRKPGLGWKRVSDSFHSNIDGVKEYIERTKAAALLDLTEENSHLANIIY